ncbi:MAG TPA: DpnII family type II restriction endonuclease [Bryobacteraceae bacterium]
MKFQQMHLAPLLAEFAELPAGDTDEISARVVAAIPPCLERLRALTHPLTAGDLEQEFRANPVFLDVCRLFIGRAQEPVAHEICAHLGRSSGNWGDLKKAARRDPAKMASVMVALEVPALIEEQLNCVWRSEDMLVERYQLTRGRAMSGQSRGRSLENEVDRVLAELGILCEKRKTFTGREGKQAKCDFAVPSMMHPKIVIESKGFEATGSKLTDFLGDVLKIGEAKAYHMYFFVVTDGRGWHNRESDLKRLISFQHDGLIDMIYTRARLGELGRDVKQIFENEM